MAILMLSLTSLVWLAFTSVGIAMAQSIMRKENGNMSRVAQKVGLERTHLYRKLKQLGIKFGKNEKDDSPQ